MGELSYGSAGVTAVAPTGAAPRADATRFALGTADAVALGAAQASFNSAIRKDTGDWSLWFDLARTSAGKALQIVALARATKLDPLSPKIATFRSDIDSQFGISVTAGATP